MPRIILTGTVAAAVLLVPAASGTAAPAATTVVSRSALPAGFTFAKTNSAPDACTQQTATASYSHLTGPTRAPLGQGSLAITSAGGSELSKAFTASESALTTFKVATVASTDTVAHAVILAVNSQGGGWQLTSQLPAGGWTTTNVLNDPNMLWWFRTTSAQAWEVQDTGTYADFVSGDPGVQLSGIAITVDSCNLSDTETTAVDDLAVGISGTTTTYDFEPLATTLTPHLSAASIVAGRHVTPSVTIKVPGPGLHEVKVTLSKKAAVAARYTTVTSVLTNAQGLATAPAQRPTTTTRYRWTYSAPSGNTFGSAASAASTVRVAPKVTITTPKHAVGAHKSVLVTGTASPKHTGATVTLWEQKGKHHVKLSHAREKASGKFRLTKRLPGGTYHLFVTVASTATNSAGTSAKHKVTVH
jgi:hypothetical protein